MFTKCDYCNKKLLDTQSLYFGYDHVCCSNMCRNDLSKIIMNKDARMSNPEKWRIFTRKSSSYNLYNLIDRINDTSLSNELLKDKQKTDQQKKLFSSFSPSTSIL